jgi:DNA-binding protein YbaB
VVTESDELPGEYALDEAGRAWAAMVRACERIEALEVRAEAGRGSVVAVADGGGTLTGLIIAPASFRHADADRLGRQVLEAIRLVEQEAETRRGQLFGEVAFAGRPLPWSSDRPGRSPAREESADGRVQR